MQAHAHAGLLKPDSKMQIYVREGRRHCATAATAKYVNEIGPDAMLLTLTLAFRYGLGLMMIKVQCRISINMIFSTQRIYVCDKPALNISCETNQIPVEYKTAVAREYLAEMLRNRKAAPLDKLEEWCGTARWTNTPDGVAHCHR